MRKWKLWQKVVGIVLISLLMIFGAAAFYLKQNTYTATSAAQKKSEQAIHEKNYDFYSNAGEIKSSIIFYPGALVESESYSEWASQVASMGYNVYILHMPLNLAVFSQDAAQEVIEDSPEERFVLAGHSLGGVIASRFAAEHPKEVAGLIFLASYPDEKGTLKNTDLSVLSITASNDKVLDMTKYRKAKVYMPKRTTFAEIKGGNHAGFGSYGAQKGDGTATISNEDQQIKISHQIVTWLKELEEG
ncbi:MAG: alpha/beta hydrolase [Tetragenococcus koreensis]|nr:alpha/beta hydrolase [Tetragenococcus koreensis]MDN6268169.1 alpha/beta hydrolase [Tetragenococcus koreensis]MDN6568474.1 alpha/beta hydrolase [Tetragenococcus halophilus]MDN6607322.1 alpha/beta hydrolase [Tetragenococcus halophilus]MDN6729275.1 alpha/beta hydrolase [Alkalibacterium sp.]